MKQQTAMTLLIRKLHLRLNYFLEEDADGQGVKIIDNIIGDAQSLLEKEKEQIIKAHNQSWHDRDDPYKTADVYYNETYKQD